MITLKQIQELDRELALARSNYDRAQGARRMLLKQLRDTRGCATLEEAKKLLSKLEKQKQALSKKLQEAYDEFNEKWQGHLDGDRNEG